MDLTASQANEILRIPFRALKDAVERGEIAPTGMRSGWAGPKANQQFPVYAPEDLMALAARLGRSFEIATEQQAEFHIQMRHRQIERHWRMAA